MKKCKYCGQELEDQAKACFNCGRPVEAEAETVSALENEASNENPSEAEMVQNSGQGKGYWQYGQWHPIEELENQKMPSSADQPWQQQGGGTNAYPDRRFPGTGGYSGSVPPQYDNLNYSPNGYPNYDQNYGPYNRAGSRTNGFAVASLILALLSAMFNAIYMIPSVLAIVFGVIALVQIHKRPDLYQGKAIAVISIVIAAITFVFYLYIFILVFQMMQDPAFIQMLQEPNLYENLQEYLEQMASAIRRVVY